MHTSLHRVSLGDCWKNQGRFLGCLGEEEACSPENGWERFRKETMSLVTSLGSWESLPLTYFQSSVLTDPVHFLHDLSQFYFREEWRGSPANQRFMTSSMILKAKAPSFTFLSQNFAKYSWSYCLKIKRHEAPGSSTPWVRTVILWFPAPCQG